jgi:protocatechuate 3,4-dioxygenase beta subunit
MADSIGLANEPIRYRLEGQIIDGSTGLGIDAVVVDLWDAEGLSSDLVAHAKTNALGQFNVTIDADYYRAIFLDRRPALNFRLYKEGQLPQPTTTWQPSETATQLRITLPDLSRRPRDAPAHMVVRGRVTQANGTPMAEVSVQAYDQTLRLNTTTTTQ